MAAEISFLSITEIQKLDQHQNKKPVKPNSVTSSFSNFMWSPKEIHHQEEEDSWEVRAFAEDTNVMGSTWPPRFYNCSFCRREFRSAQALGGHMNVHRRDRARLHQVSTQSSSSSIISSSSANASHGKNGGMCYFYQVPKPSNAFIPIGQRGTMESSSKFFNISPPSMNFPVASQTTAANFSYRYCGKAQDPSSSSSEKGHEELDLELRLGHRRTPA